MCCADGRGVPGQREGDRSGACPVQWYHPPMPLRLLVLVVLATACRSPAPLTPKCSQPTTRYLQAIKAVFDRQQAGTKTPGDASSSRKNLERARFVLTGTGIDDESGQCTADDRGRTSHASLLTALADRQKMVEWLESERGLRFTGLTDGTPDWIWVKTGESAERDIAGEL